jgi:hypothetical protein
VYSLLAHSVVAQVDSLTLDSRSIALMVAESTQLAEHFPVAYSDNSRSLAKTEPLACSLESSRFAIENNSTVPMSGLVVYYRSRSADCFRQTGCPGCHSAMTERHWVQLSVLAADLPATS